MQLVTAIIQPFMVDRLTRALRKAKVSGYTVEEVQGSGVVGDEPAYVRPRSRVEVAVNDDRVEEIIDLITRTVSTHQQGDGIIYAVPISRFIHIESGKADMNALGEKK
ncbi:MAG TPA: P-II family nitrogen regulator [Candidatus Obscuribacter sp.]|nr:P-II family nitrogen regulator [Candidatus Obscuribacter sp.]MBK9281163.1 P-II family nitrogen regulator [Candidatus Obscuribacter sp.]HMY05288.1 P-II family nitrogen regulator [Candidatus Obscuribacter sp.]HMY55489.1 P-II family nitrogen regulator [Candidatus Obscuribacter sp.]HND07422.1 P-II family nitrogen regulator [Candidatus Obscuribacter sp.]